MGAIGQTVRADLALRTLANILNDSLSDILPAERIQIGQSASKHPIPRLPVPYIFLEPLSLPAMDGTFTDEAATIIPLEYGEAEIMAATVGREYKIRVNTLPVKYTAGGGDSVSDIRDALIAGVTALGEDVTPSIIDASTLRVTPNTTGALYTFETPTSETRLVITNTDETFPTIVEYKIGRRRFTLRVNAYSDPAETVFGGAHALVARAYNALDAKDSLLTLRDYRFAMRPISDPVNLSGIKANESGKEQRASFDMLIDVSALAVYDASAIETVEVTVNILGAEASPITFTTP